MPTYEYKCPKCQKTKDVIHPMIDRPVISCEDCEVVMKKQIGCAAVHFKGSGFYENDYKKK